MATSALQGDQPHAFLADEWNREKPGVLHVYPTLSGFLGEYFDGVAFSFDQNKQELIESLFGSGSFARTHELVAKLEDFSCFSAKEVAQILDAVPENNQFGHIVGDNDVSDFLHRVAAPHSSGLTKEEHKDILRGVAEDQADRASQD